MKKLLAGVTTILLTLSGTGLAHVESAGAVGPLAWTWEPWVLGAIVISGCLYGLGLRALWRRAGAARGIKALQAGCFAAGLTVLVVALVSPLDALGAQLFAAHMGQHELLMLVAAPLLVLGRPLATWLWAPPPSWRRSVRSATNNPIVAAVWSRMTAPPVAWVQHAIVIWIWHAPRLFDAALGNVGIHALQHVSFLASALLFWWPLMPHASRALHPGPASIYLFTTMLHTGALGVLLTLSTAVWYAPYADTSSAWGLTALEDQELGGLIMWVPAGAVYIATSLLLLGRWLRLPTSAPIKWSTERLSTPESTSR